MRTMPLCLAVLLVSCSQPQPSSLTPSVTNRDRLGSPDHPSKPGPPTTSEKSSARPNLVDRIAFIEQYVPLDRTYLQLEYDVVYHNNSGGWVPGPSDLGS